MLKEGMWSTSRKLQRTEKRGIKNQPMKYFYETTVKKPISCGACDAVIHIGESRYRHKRNGTYKDDVSICDSCYSVLSDVEWIDAKTKDPFLKGFLKKAKKIMEAIK